MSFITIVSTKWVGEELAEERYLELRPGWSLVVDKTKNTVHVLCNTETPTTQLTFGASEISRTIKFPGGLQDDGSVNVVEVFYMGKLAWKTVKITKSATGHSTPTIYQIERV